MKAILSRTYSPTETKGSFFLFDGEAIVFKGKTLELPNNGNQRMVSCIPEGIYDVIRWHSDKFGDCFLVTNVPGREAILIHIGNYTTDTKGCILVGDYFSDLNSDGNIDVGDSTKAMLKLLKVAPVKFKLHII